MSYWNALSRARTLLAESRLVQAEETYAEARRLRSQSPGRVFLSETLGDAARKTWRRLRQGTSAEDPGRWDRDCREFRRVFREAARALLNDAEERLGGRARAADLLLLSEAAVLAAGGELVAPEPGRCAPILLQALAAAAAGGVRPDPRVVPAPEILPPEGAMTVAAAVAGLLRTPAGGSETDAELAARAAALLPRGPEAADAAGLRGELAERAGHPNEAVEDYLVHLAAAPLSHPESARIRVRAVDLLANLQEHRLAVPRYDEAEALLATGAEGGEAAARIKARRSGPETATWSVSTRRGDRWWTVLWRDARPVDVAWWDEGTPRASLDAFLEPCAGRLLTLDPGCPWSSWLLEELLEVLACGTGSGAGTDEAGGSGTWFDLARAEHPSLGGNAPEGVPAALAAGRTWIEGLTALTGDDPALRTGLHALARAGDGPGALLASFLPPELVPGEGWPLRPLRERPAPPLGGGAEAPVGGDPMVDLGQAGDAVVVSGRPGRVLAAWGGRRGRWRVVLDDLGRLRDLAPVLELRGGLRTVLPGAEAVDDPDRAVAALEELLGDEGRARNDLLPLLHWFRLSRTHNGDLTDGLPGGDAPGLVRRYRAWVEERRVAGTGRWQEELAVRAAASDVVVGSAERLDEDRRGLARTWGVSAAEPAAWAFCDAAVICWRRRRGLACRPDPLHRELKSLAEASLLICVAAVFRREDLEAELLDWLGSPGALLRAATDTAPPLLGLAGEFPVPDARVGLGKLVGGLLDRTQAWSEEGRNVVFCLESGRGPCEAALAARAQGLFGDPALGPVALDLDAAWCGPAPEPGTQVVVPRLESLEDGPGGGPPEEITAAWRTRDARRRDDVGARRRAAALEVNAWLGRGGDAVFIADARWWREFPAATAADPATACREAAGDAAVLVSPPPEASATSLAAGRWLREQGWLEADGYGLPDGELALPEGEGGEPDAARTVGLWLGSPARPWARLLRQATLWAEAGQETDWLLVVSETPPPGAGVVAEAGRAARHTLPPRPGEAFRPAPLVWATPEVFRDDDVRTALAEAKPRAVWVSDLRRWLPSDHGAGDGFLDALSFLLHDLGGRASLHASHLPAPWRDALAGLLGPGEVVQDDPPAFGPGTSPPVACVRVEDPEVACPGCGTMAKLSGEHDACRRCGLALLRWLPVAVRETLPERLRRAKIRAVEQRVGTTGEPPLCVWAPSRERGDWCRAFEAAGVRWRRARTLSLAPEDRDGAWLLCLFDDQAEVPSECRHVLLTAPQDAQELADLRQRCAGELLLCHHPLDGALAETAVGRQAPGRDALEPLRAADLAPPPSLSEAWGWHGVLAPRLQEIVTGCPSAHVLRALGTVRWLGALAGGTPEEAEIEEARTPRLEFRQTRLELEFRAGRLDALVDTLLPSLLADLPPGSVGRLDLADLPLEVDEEDLAWWDRFLLASSLRLEGDEAQILYEPDGGFLRGTRRRLGWLGGPDAAAEALRRRRDRLLAELGAVLGDDAVEPAELDPELLETGVLLGVWDVVGPPGPAEARVLPHETVGRSDGTAARRTAARLLAGLGRDRERWRERLDEAWRIGFMEEVPRVAPAPDPAEDGRGEGELVAALAAFLLEQRRGLRLLEGPRGSGRLAVVVAALGRACRADLAPGRITVVAPNTAVAARFHALWRRTLPGLEAPEAVLCATERLGGGGLDPASLPGGEPAAVTVVLGLEDVPAALRYRLANRAAGERLVMVLEPELCRESREHLLPALPPPERILRTDGLVDTPRNLRDDLAELISDVAPGRGYPRAGSPRRGDVQAARVAGLDDALARIEDRCRTLALEEPLELVAPVLQDLETLGRSAARLGWLPVYAWELEALRLPGAAEFMAAVCDASALGEDGEAAEPIWTAPLLSPARRSAAAEWFRRRTSPDEPLHAFWARLARAPWADGLFGGGRGMARVSALVVAAGEDTVRRTATRPLAEVWRLAAAQDPLGAAPSGPAMVLTTPELAGGGRCRATAYLCTGLEPERQHYAVLSRADETVLALYQTRSPLPSSRDDD